MFIFLFMASCAINEDPFLECSIKLITSNKDFFYEVATTKELYYILQKHPIIFERLLENHDIFKLLTFITLIKILIQKKLCIDQKKSESEQGFAYLEKFYKNKFYIMRKNKLAKMKDTISVIISTSETISKLDKLINEFDAIKMMLCGKAQMSLKDNSLLEAKEYKSDIENIKLIIGIITADAKEREKNKIDRELHNQNSL